MTMTQFAMVEELASLIRDNLYCKHLVLSVEEALINFIHNDSNQNGLIELQPVGPYYRLLLHRLADIYGFSHESVGEGDDRHLVLERSSETAIPPILISDILWQYDGCEPPTTPSHNILRRKEVQEIQKTKTLTTSMSLEEKEAAYQAARERIFSVQDNTNNKELVIPKSRTVPVIAQRMIAHALGTKISSSRESPATDQMIETSEPMNSEHSKQSLKEKKLHHKHTVKKSNPVNMEREQKGAAKRIFANALGLKSGKLNQDSS